MGRMFFLIYGLIIVIGCTMANVMYASDSTGSSRGWGRGSSYSGGSGGWHSSGGHK